MSEHQSHDFQEFYERGIVSDLFLAQYHYFIYRMIGENYPLIEQIKEVYEQNVFGHMQLGSHDRAILSLCKFYDSPHRRFNTSCLRKVFQKCRQLDSAHFPLNTVCDWNEEIIPYPSLLKIEELTGIKRPVMKFHDPTDFLDYLESTLSSPDIQQKLENLKIARDKFIAHNELQSDIQSIPSYWDDFLDLLYLGRHYSNLIGELFASYNHERIPVESRDQIHLDVLGSSAWLHQKLVKHIGHRNVKTLWD